MRSHPEKIVPRYCLKAHRQKGKMFQIELDWINDAGFTKFGHPQKSIEAAISLAERTLQDVGTSVRDARITSKDGEIHWVKGQTERELHTTQEVQCSFMSGGNIVTGVVVNPGGWFGKVWLIQVAIANALNPLFAVEADTAQEAIDEFADSRFSNLIDVPEDDQPKTDGDAEANCHTTAGNDSHYVNLSNVTLTRAPTDLRYIVRWHPLQDGLSAVINQELSDIRAELSD